MNKKLCIYYRKSRHYTKECLNKQSLYATQGKPEEKLPSQSSSVIDNRS
jgi:hypothetical protein